jgi:lipoprotein-anchoring transpeptidase ErfK/SrfK
MMTTWTARLTNAGKAIGGLACVGLAASLALASDASAAKKKAPVPAVTDVSATDSAGQGKVLFDLFNDGDMSAGAVAMSFNAKFNPGEIVVSFADRRLYYIDGKGHALAYPIAVPREDARWAGVTVISDKRVNPAWTPTPHMLAKNPNLPSFVPGGHPMNPLGVRAMYLAGGEYRIHGTDAPWTIGTAASSGCIRMFNQDAIDLFNRAKVGARVTVTWDHFAS